ncbi:MAG: tetratricopeptide repeat protein [Gallionella sp.]|nr:tetratricopeptide repeat protein [Gallionella sp.]
MSLLLDARRKQQAQGVHVSHAAIDFSFDDQPGLAVTGSNIPPITSIREAGQNLFGAKSPASPASHTGIKRNLLLTLGGTIVTFAAGAGYFWHNGFASNTQPPHPEMSVPVLRAMHFVTPAVPKIRNAFAMKTVMTHSSGSTPKSLLAAIVPPSRNESLPVHVSRESSPIRIGRQETGLVDPLLDNAYLAYRNGDLGAAQQLYRKMLGRDARNTDALLGLAVIAQQRGEDMLASQYYSRVLALDPRNALANAGMSVLTEGDGNEDRLEALLDEQKDSAILHFALGNRYAEQLRWVDAQQTYFNAYTLEPGNAEFAFNLAVSLDHLGQNKLAAQYYQRALHLDQTGSDRERGLKFDHAQTEQRVRELIR